MATDKKLTKVSLSAAEMNADQVTVVFPVAAGAQWKDAGAVRAMAVPPDPLRLSFTVPGRPVGGHKEAGVRGGRVQFYYNKNVAAYIKAVSAAARQAVKEHGWGKPARDVPLRVDMFAYCPMPQSWSKKRKAAMHGRLAVAFPDRDNLMKTVQDGMVGVRLGPRTYEGIVFDDDRQIASGSTTRRWCFEGEERVEVIVEVADDYDA
jgi:Holliday junction resolvase RusA-like endonuclease